MKKNKKERRLLDMENVLTKFSMMSNLFVMLPLAIFNCKFLKNDVISGVVIGWCVCLIGTTIVSSIVGYNNHRYVIDKYVDAMDKAAKEAKKDAKKKSARKDNTNAHK